MIKMVSEIFQGFMKALWLITSGNKDLIEITFRSLAISGFATILSSFWSIPLGILIGLEKFRGRSFVKGIFSTMLGVPTVTLGLILWLVLSSSGPLGFMHLLYTPTAVIIGQSVLITPIMVSFIASTLESMDPEIGSLALTLGASEIKAKLMMLTESLGGVFLAIMASFNRAIAELGVALMLGGNIRGVTRVLTTTIALETNRGELALGIALTMILIIIVGTVNFVVSLFRRRL
jgi:tungstate transport system permease protein